MKALALVALGGGLGATFRYLLATALMRGVTGTFPFGTLAVNVLGCLLIGLWAGLAARHHWMAGDLRLFLVTGVLGGFTTFSAFGLESLHLLRRGEWLLSGLYIGTSLVLGLSMVALGWWLGGGATSSARP